MPVNASGDGETIMICKPHRFHQYTVCVDCGQTEAAIDGCHHCNETRVGVRCFWCLRVRGAETVDDAYQRGWADALAATQREHD